MSALQARMGDKAWRRWRRVTGAIGMLAIGVVGSGIALLFTREPNAQWTNLAQRGSSARPAIGVAEPLQDMHSSLSLLFMLAMFLLISWTMGVVIGEWSTSLFLILAVLGVGILSGWMVGFLAVSVDGTYQPDLRGYGFVFDGGFDNVLTGSRTLGATAFRIWNVVHLLVLPAIIALLVKGMRSWNN